MNIHIIDDNKDITDAISLFAESQNHQCTISNDGREGYDRIINEDFDLILLDIAMPEFSGYDILSKLTDKGNFEMSKIVVITASNLDGNASGKIEALGIYKLVRKPLSLEALEDIFSKFV